MGQRHQLFVIAKLGHRYRPLAAVHNQWLYGEGPLRRCRHLLQVFPALANRVPIAQELRAAREKSDDFWARDDIFQPFPFIATCLTVGSSFDPEVGYQRRVHPLTFNTSPEQADNNDGITVIDISNLDRLRYCFAFPEEQEVEYDSDNIESGYTDQRGPLKASKYLSRYVNPRKAQKLDTHTRQRYEELVKQVESYELIDASAFEETWSTLVPSDKDASASLVSNEVKRKLPHLSSLRHNAIDQTIDSIVKDQDPSFSSLAEAQQLPGFTRGLRSKLIALAEADELPSSPAIARILEAAFAGEAVVDLSRFRSLPAEHIVEVASKLLNGSTVRSLDLSHLHQLSEADLTQILAIDSRLETLYLLEMPQISIESLNAILSKSNLHLRDIYHTELLRRPMAESHKYSTLMTNIQSPPLNLSQASPIKHLLWARVSQTTEPNLRKSDGVAIDWPRAQRATNLTDNKDKIHVAVFPLYDILLPPTKLVTGLANFFACASKNKQACDWQNISSTGFTLAKAFATAFSTLPQEGAGDATQMGALPETLFGAASIAAKTLSVDWPVPFLELKEGEWAVVVVNEHDPFNGLLMKKADDGKTIPGQGEDQEKFRLAFITPSRGDLGGDYRVESMEGFLEELLGGKEEREGVREGKTEEMESLVGFWKRKTGFVGMCGEEEVREVVPAISRCVAALRAEKHFWMVEKAWEDF